MDKGLFVSVCEDNGWDVHEEGAVLEIHQYSPAGEDFSFCVSNAYDPDEVFDYYWGFDSEEHCLMWADARRNGAQGVPDLFELVDDAKAIEAMLDELARSLIVA